MKGWRRAITRLPSSFGVSLVQSMGFIVANMPGAIAGGVAGNRLGAIRDKRGKSVYSVYQELEQPEKMRLLSELASKVFAHAIS